MAGTGFGGRTRCGSKASMTSASYVFSIRLPGVRAPVLADITGLSRDSGVAARLSTNLLCGTAHDGLIQEVRTFIDLDRALAAAGEG